MTNQPQTVALLVPEIKELLSGRQFVLLKQVLRECNPNELVDVWKRFSEEERVQIFRLLSGASALKLFEIIGVEDQKMLLEQSSDERLAPILENTDSPDLARLFHKMSPRVIKKMHSLLKRQETISHVDFLMTFPEGTAGSLMHPEFVRLSPKLTAKQALLRLQCVIRPHQKEHLDSLFVVDDDGRPLGQVDLHDLITAAEDAKLSELMESIEAYKLKPETDQEEASNVFSKYQVKAAPVVDDSGRLIGVLNVKDAITVVREEATEDIAKMAGTQAADVQERSVLKVVRLRMPWLIVTLGGGMVVSLIIRSFEPILAEIIALATFSPLIAGMGGNVGSQSATVVVRSLALGNLKDQHKLATIARESAVGLFMGAAYGLVLGGIAYLLYGAQYHAQFAFVVGFSMCVAMTIAATMGAVGPIVNDRLGIDPATATGPMITTITDIISNFTYFTLATLLLSHL